MPLSIRQLVHGDEAAAEAFLAYPQRSDTTMILRSNLNRAGLVFNGDLFEGTYVGAFEGGGLAGVVAHYWNDNLVLAGGPHTASLARHVVAVSGRRVRGLLGPYAETTKAQTALGLGPPSHEGKEILFALDLAELVVPPALVAEPPRFEARTPNDSEMPMLLEWRMAYAAETMGIVDTAETRVQQEQTLRAFHASGDDVVLFDGGEPVAYTAFNATVRDMVQVGGVWTPPAVRGRGYARYAVASSLLRMRRDRSASKAILFTAENNVAAQKSYTALGFRVTGDYAIFLFE
jgi:uncharacterized protein